MTQDPGRAGDAPWLDGAGRALAVLPALLLVPFAVLLLFARPQADDYCFGFMYRDHGFVATLVEFYLRLAGRFLANSVIMVPFVLNQQLGLDLLWTYRALCALVLAAHVAVAWWAVGALYPAASMRLRGALAGMLAFVLVAGSPAPDQLIYWISQIGNYTLAALAAFVLTIRLAWLTERRRALSRAETTAWAVVGAVTATSTEISGIVLLCILAGAYAVRRLTPGAPRQAVAHAAIIAAVAAAGAVVLISPSVLSRMSYYQTVERPGGSAGDVVLATGLAALRWLDFMRLRLSTPAVPGWLMVVALATWFYDRRPGAPPPPPKPGLVIALPLLAILVAIFGALWIGQIGLGQFLPTRSRGHLHLALTAAATLVTIDATRAHGERVRAWLARRRPALTLRGAVAIVLLLVIATPKSVLALWTLAAEVPQFDREMTARYARLGTMAPSGAPPRDEVLRLPTIRSVPRLPFFSEFSEDTLWYDNVCQARYYGWRAIVRDSP